MKKMIMTTIALMLLTSPVFAGNKLVDTSEAVETALATFESDNGQATVNLYKGIKAAPNSHGVTVKVYLTDGSKINYACHRHEAADPFECHISN